MEINKPIITYKHGLRLCLSIGLIAINILIIYLALTDTEVLDKHVYIEGVLEIEFSPFWARVNHHLFQLYILFMTGVILYVAYHSHIKKKYIKLYEERIVCPQVTRPFIYSDVEMFYDDITSLRWSFRRYTGTNYKIISKDKTVKISSLDLSTKKIKEIDKFIRERAKNLED